MRVRVGEWVGGVRRTGAAGHGDALRCAAAARKASKGGSELASGGRRWVGHSARLNTEYPRGIRARRRIYVCRGAECGVCCCSVLFPIC